MSTINKVNKKGGDEKAFGGREARIWEKRYEGKEE
jgi:hypothetical protein